MVIVIYCILNVICSKQSIRINILNTSRVFWKPWDAVWFSQGRNGQNDKVCWMSNTSRITIFNKILALINIVDEFKCHGYNHNHNDGKHPDNQIVSAEKLVKFLNFCRFAWNHWKSDCGEWLRIDVGFHEVTHYENGNKMHLEKK